MKDIVFINPPNHARTPFMPMGLCTLDRIVRNAGYDSEVLDMQNRLLYEKQCPRMDILETWIREHPARLYGFSIWNVSYPWMAELIKTIKSHTPEAGIIAGGPLATLMGKRLLEKHPDLDAVAVYEGEKIIVPLLEAWPAGKGAAWQGIKNVYYRTAENTVAFHGLESFVEDLDTLPDIPLEDEFYFTRFLNIEAGRGCAHRCTFCSSHYVWKHRPRFKSADRVMAVAEQYYRKLKQAGVKDPILHFEHDNFLARKTLLEDMARKKTEQALSFQFGCSAKIDALTDETLRLLKKASCRYVYCGIETGSERIQEAIRKNIRLANVLPTVRKLLDAGIQVTANFIVGFPEETLEDLYKTLDLMAELRWLGATVHANLLNPEPCTPIWKAARPEDYRLMRHSPFFAELKQAGLDPLSYDREFVNHLYSLSSKHYDTPSVEAFLALLLFVLRHFPLTLFLVRGVKGVGWETLLRTHKDGCADAGDAVLSVDAVFAFLQACGAFPDLDTEGPARDILHYEYHVAGCILNRRAQEKAHAFSTDIKKTYPALLKNPERLLGENRA